MKARELTYGIAVYGVFLLGTACGEDAVSLEDETVEVDQLRRGTQCGPTIDWFPVNSYQSDLPWVQELEEATVLISSVCTGTYVRLSGSQDPYILSAGHCFQLGETVSVRFNFETAPDGPEFELEGRVIEISAIPDYALIRLESLPPVRSVRLGTRLTPKLFAFQHPLGQPKIISEGEMVICENGILEYAEIDTLVGSSGAGVLNELGELLAVHALGLCNLDGTGVNAGWVVEAIAEVSDVLSLDDIH